MKDLKRWQPRKWGLHSQTDPCFFFSSLDNRTWYYWEYKHRCHNCDWRKNRRIQKNHFGGPNPSHPLLLARFLPAYRVSVSTTRNSVRESSSAFPFRQLWAYWKISTYFRSLGRSQTFHIRFPDLTQFSSLSRARWPWLNCQGGWGWGWERGCVRGTQSGRMREGQLSLTNPHCTVRTAQSALHSPHCTVRTAQSALHSPHCTVRTAQSALHSPHCTVRTAQSALHSPHSSGDLLLWTAHKRVTSGEEEVRDGGRGLGLCPRLFQWRTYGTQCTTYSHTCLWKKKVIQSVAAFYRAHSSDDGDEMRRTRP